jgi:60 kDa SS-A/Ro ribonucleoprotein
MLMANKSVFKTGAQTKARPTSHRNRAGGKAYKLEDAEALCQYVVTSTFSDVYYASAGEQLAEVQRICENVDPQLVAKAAVYGRERGKMKDVPAYLLAHLAAQGEIELLRKAFPRVINNPKMLLNFVQIIRSGVTGRRSFGSAVKKLIQNWITSRRGNQLFMGSIGKSDPSLTDVIKMVHPTPANTEQSALFAYLLGAEVTHTVPDMLVRKDRNGKVVQEYAFEDLPPLVQEFEWFKYDNSMPLPDMDYRALTNCNLTPDHWKQIALNMPWNTLRMNLNVLERNGVFKDAAVTKKIVAKLSNEKEVEKWSVFPYQLMTSYLYADGVPSSVKNALQKAMEHATKNVPVLGDRVGIAVDVSGSMSSAVTGNRGAASSKVSCLQAAALIASSLARTNPDATVVSFGTNARVVPNYNAWDSVMTNAQKLSGESRYVGHGTNADSAMRVFNATGKYDFIVFVSDCQSWVDSRHSMFGGYGRGYGGSVAGATPLMASWEVQKKGNRNAKLAEINVQPYGDSQADSTDKSILNVGGFSDAVFDVLAEFSDRKDNVSFADVVNRVDL